MSLLWDGHHQAAMPEEDLLKMLLWQRHGCSVGYLKLNGYCNRCGIDFKNKSAIEIWDSFEKLSFGAREIK